MPGRRPRRLGQVRLAKCHILEDLQDVSNERPLDINGNLRNLGTGVECSGLSERHLDGCIGRRNGIDEEGKKKTQKEVGDNLLMTGHGGTFPTHLPKTGKSDRLGLTVLSVRT